MAGLTGMLPGLGILGAGGLSIRYASEIAPTKWRVEMTVRSPQGMGIVDAAIFLVAWPH